ncbi:hypothetical protein GCM10020000_63150 [Streptomyces olivoverticillatus]
MICPFAQDRSPAFWAPSRIDARGDRAVDAGPFLLPGDDGVLPVPAEIAVGVLQVDQAGVPVVERPDHLGQDREELLFLLVFAVMRGR